MTSTDPETISWIRLLLAFSVVAGLLALLTFGLRAMAKYGFLVSGHGKLAKGSLKIIESLPLDGRRRLVIVRWGKKDHLLVLGPDHATVVSSEPASESDSTFEKTSPT